MASTLIYKYGIIFLRFLMAQLISSDHHRTLRGLRIPEALGMDDFAAVIMKSVKVCSASSTFEGLENEVVSDVS